MTTARERMKALSGLSGAHSAREHFLAITQGTGSGVDRIIFAAQMTVCLETEALTVIRKPAVSDSSSPRQEPESHHDPKQKRIDVVTRPLRFDVRTQQESMFVIQHRPRELLVRSLPNTVHVRRSRTVKTI